MTSVEQKACLELVNTLEEGGLDFACGTSWEHLSMYVKAGLLLRVRCAKLRGENAYAKVTLIDKAASRSLNSIANVSCIQPPSLNTCKFGHGATPKMCWDYMLEHGAINYYDLEVDRRAG